MLPKIDKPLVRERFERRLGSYASHAVVQKAMARELAEMICRNSASSAFNRVLEVGSGSGAFTAELLSRSAVKEYYANDLVEESRACLEGVLALFPVELFHFLSGDIEHCDALPQELDLVASNATLQWLEDLDLFFRRISDHLLPGGMLAFTTFSTRNMQEISTIEGGGLGYYSIKELEMSARRYFDVVTIREEDVRMEFPTPEAVLHHIRQTGVNGLHRRLWTKSRYQHFLDRYRHSFSCENGVYLTYHPVYCCLKKSLS
ncbi:MAG: malonyl-ACP O-methyltransferase BioC [Chlorobiaceae bacterium]|nr:malonyl-ACP O-methyltransferase BioC [Chlorobiaceae bacterium]